MFKIHKITFKITTKVACSSEAKPLYQVELASDRTIMSTNNPFFFTVFLSFFHPVESSKHLQGTNARP